MGRPRQDNDAQSRRLMEARGFIIQKVEFHNVYSGKKRDLFGVFDYLAVKSDKIIGVQTTSYGSDRVRCQKILKSPRAYIWLVGGGHIEVHGWKRFSRKNADGSRSKKMYSWSLRLTIMDKGWDFPNVVKREAMELLQKKDLTWLKKLGRINPQLPSTFM